MNRFKIGVYIIIAFLTSCGKKAEVYDLRKNFPQTDSIPPKGFLKVIDSSSSTLNYVRPLFAGWQFRVNNPYLNQNGNTVDINSILSLLRAYSVIGDEKNVLEHTPTFYHPPIIDSSLRETEIKVFDARDLVLREFATSKVIMFNTSYERTESRAFLLDILDDLHTKGATHLALDEEVPNLTSASIGATELLAEPIMAQIIRKASKLGIKVFSYADTSKYEGHLTSFDNRETHAKWQALNLYLKLKELAAMEKVIVLGGYSSISEESYNNDDPQFAQYFKNISGIDPLTVDQLALMYKSINGLCSRSIFDSLYKQKPQKSVAIEKELMQKFFTQCRPSSITDLYVCHPETEFVEQRPKWLLSSNKIISRIAIPDQIEPVLVQAYIAEEINNTSDFGRRVPFDQTSFVIANHVSLLLAENSHYKIIYRSATNDILFSEDYKTN